MHSKKISQDQSLEFILGGNALFTLLSVTTGTRFTYKVLIDSRNNNILRVSMLCGSDNTKDFKMIGQINIDPNSGQPEFKSLSVHTRDIPASIAFSHVFLNLIIQYPMPSLEIWHSGRCCRCGRLLTVPESIDRGIGPECISKESKVNFR